MLDRANECLRSPALLMQRKIFRPLARNIGPTLKKTSHGTEAQARVGPVGPITIN